MKTKGADGRIPGNKERERTTIVRRAPLMQLHALLISQLMMTMASLHVKEREFREFSAGSDKDSI